MRPHTSHTPPSCSPHSNTATQQHKEKAGSTTRGNATQRGTGAIRGARSNSKTGNTVKRTGTTRGRGGQHNHTPLPPFNVTTKQTEGGHHTQDGEASNTAALHSPCHPPPTMPPHHPQRPHPPPRRGGSTQRIPHHTNSTDRHTPTHTTHPARNSSMTRPQYSPALQWDE